MEGEAQKKTELAVGIFLLIGMLLLGGIVLKFGNFTDAFYEHYTVKVFFDNASGIVEGSPVKLGGATIGRVKETPMLNDDYTGVIVPLEIKKRYRVPAGSAFQVGSAGLMGDALVEITPPSQPSGETIDFNSKEILKGSAPGGTQVESALGQLSHAVENLDEGFLGDENSENLKGSLAKLNSAIAKLDDEVLNEANSENISQTISNLKTLSADLKTSGEKIGPAADKLKEAAESARELMHELHHGDGLAAALVHDKQMKEDFRALIANLRRHGVLRYRNSGSKSDSSSKELDDRERQEHRERRKKWRQQRDKNRTALNQEAGDSQNDDQQQGNWLSRLIR